MKPDSNQDYKLIWKLAGTDRYFYTITRQEQKSTELRDFPTGNIFGRFYHSFPGPVTEKDVAKQINLLTEEDALEVYNYIRELGGIICVDTKDVTISERKKRRIEKTYGNVKLVFPFQLRFDTLLNVSFSLPDNEESRNPVYDFYDFVQGED